MRASGLATYHVTGHAKTAIDDVEVAVWHVTKSCYVSGLHCG